MKEPERLLQGGSALERSLLSASNDEAPSSDLERRVLAAMAAAPLAAGAASSSSTIARWLSSSTAKIGLATVVVGAVIVGAMLRREPPSVATSALQTATAAPVEAPTPTTASSQAVVVMTPNALPNAQAPAPAKTGSASARVATTNAAAVAPVPTTVASASIAREIELLDAVKTKLGAGSASDAARALDAYDSEFPQGAGTLRPEATVLRIRTLLLAGDRARAEKLGGEFLSQHPNGVHAKRVRALLEEK